MRRKLEYVVPSLQVLLAIALLVWTYRWQEALMRIQDMPGTPPFFALLIAINAPLAFPRALVFRHLPGWWEWITLVVAIGMLWYWVSLNIKSWRQSRRVFMFSWTPLRLAGDAVAVGIGAMWVFVLLRDRAFRLPVLISSKDWLWFVPCWCLTILWAATLILLFGRDFAQCLLPSKDE